MYVMLALLVFKINADCVLCEIKVEAWKTVDEM
jgi:hypothetical protein